MAIRSAVSEHERACALCLKEERVQEFIEDTFLLYRKSNVLQNGMNIVYTCANLTIHLAQVYTTPHRQMEWQTEARGRESKLCQRIKPQGTRKLSVIDFGRNIVLTALRIVNSRLSVRMK